MARPEPWAVGERPRIGLGPTNNEAHGPQIGRSASTIPGLSLFMPIRFTFLTPRRALCDDFSYRPFLRYFQFVRRKILSVSIRADPWKRVSSFCPLSAFSGRGEKAVQQHRATREISIKIKRLRLGKACIGGTALAGDDTYRY
jgi:hypothetical protein